jgi:hypothetical protein
MISIFSFPRSGSTWFLESLNTIEGIDICNEPVYGLRGHRIERWLGNRHSTFFEGKGAYRGDYMQPTPSANMQDNMPKLFEDLGEHKWGHNGFKEVYLCYKIPLALEGLRAGGAEPRVIHLWRGFDGVAASFAKRDFWFWVVQTFDSQREGSKGTAAEAIYHLFDPKDDLETLFLIWLAATCQDARDVEEAGGQSILFDDLADEIDKDVRWPDILAKIGFPRRRPDLSARGWETMRVARNVEGFRALKAERLKRLRDTARPLAQELEHGESLLRILEA